MMLLLLVYDARNMLLLANGEFDIMLLLLANDEFEMLLLLLHHRLLPAMVRAYLAGLPGLPGKALASDTR